MYSSGGKQLNKIKEYVSITVLALVIGIFLSTCLSCAGHVLPKPKPPDQNALIQTMIKRTGKIDVTCENALPTSGTGFLLESKGRRGIIVTARHVVDNPPEEKCTWKIQVDGLSYQLFDIKHHDYLDISVATIYTLRNYPRVSYTDVPLGTDVIAVGYPYDKLMNDTWHTVTKGVIAAHYANRYRSTAQIYPGSSGGPIFDTYGNLVCIVSSAWLYEWKVPYDGMYYCTKASHIDDILLQHPKIELVKPLE